MYRESDLMTCLFGLAGWRQTVNPDYPVLAAGLTSSVSGLYYQDTHPLVNAEYLDQALKNYDAFIYDVYTAGAAYAVGKRVRYATDNKVYEAKVIIAAAPSTLTPGNWSEVNLFSQKIEALTRAACNKVVSAMFTQKKIDRVAKSIFDNIQLFSGVGDLMNKEMKQSRFVGFEIRLRNQRDVTMLIQRIGTQFSLANPDFKLYLFSSSQDTPVQVIDMALTRANAYTWTDATLQLKSLNSQLLPGAVYYLGYYEDQLLGNAINKGYNFAAIPCSSCNDDYVLYRQWSGMMSVAPFYVPAAYLADILPGDSNGPRLWNIGANQYTPQNNYGLNLDITSACDVTDFLCRERRLFTDAITLQVAADAMNELAYSTRNNTIAKETRDLAMYALSDQPNKNFGILTRLDNAIKAISFDFSDLDDRCLPCDNPNGLTWGAM